MRYQIMRENQLIIKSRSAPVRARARSNHELGILRARATRIHLGGFDQQPKQADKVLRVILDICPHTCYRCVITSDGPGGWEKHHEQGSRPEDRYPLGASGHQRAGIDQHHQWIPDNGATVANLLRRGAVVLDGAMGLGSDLRSGPTFNPARKARAMRYVSCPECGRTFDLNDENDEQEWHYGHDCEEA